MTSNVSLSLILPAYNEEDHITDTLSALVNVVKNNTLPYEIVVVNDGSRDQTLNKAMAYAKLNHNVRVVSYVNNMGKGFAVKKGFMEADGEVVIFTDSDFEIDLTTISRYVDALKVGDIVIASKWHPDSHVQVSTVRKIMSYSFNTIVRLLTGACIKDTQAGLKAMRKSAFLDIFPNLSVKRYAFDVELLAVARLHGLRVVELPVSITLDARFKLKDIWKMFIDLLGITYRLRVTHWYQQTNPSKDKLQHFASIIFRD